MKRHNGIELRKIITDQVKERIKNARINGLGTKLLGNRKQVEQKATILNKYFPKEERIYAHDC